jgi:hypothetical protein
MIPKPLAEITESDLLGLITNGIAESRTLDYKRSLPGNSDADKKEFLADVSSFANTAGGDLVFGIDEDEGLPTQVAGVQVADLDLETRRLNSLLEAGLSPRVRYAIKDVALVNGGRVIVIRVERSWSGPHRVIYQGHDKFYGRNSAGKYPLDVNELRTAFTLPSTVRERIRAFRTDRIIALSNNQTPIIPFQGSPKVILHCIPVQSFADETLYDILPFYHNPVLLRPMGTSTWDRRLNLDGVLAFGTHQPRFTYTQLYRTGVIEAVHGNLIGRDYEGVPIIPSQSFELAVLGYVPFCFEVLIRLGAGAPIVLALTPTQTKGLVMGTAGARMNGFGSAIDLDTLILPEVLVEDLSRPAEKILKPIFDLVWNACGEPSSENFNSDGNWTPRPR